MFPSVRLVCHPGGDGIIAGPAAFTLRIDLPEAASRDEVVAEIQQRLRTIHPLATIIVEDGGVADRPPTWHAHRDRAGA